MLSACVLAAGGCTRAAVESRGDVVGKVTNQGQPITDAVIVFENLAAGLSITADLDSEGGYSAATYLGRGLPPGTYRIAIRPRPAQSNTPLAGLAPPPESLPEYPLIPQKCRQPDTSGLTIIVLPTGNASFDFDVAR